MVQIEALSTSKCWKGVPSPGKPEEEHINKKKSQDHKHKSKIP